MKKPLPVKIVEAIGWVYVALVVWWIMFSIVTARTSEWPGGLIGGSLMLSLPVSMVFSLRTGQRFGFVVPNTVVFSFVIVASVATTLHINLKWVVLSLILLVVPEILLRLSSSRQWLREKAVESTKGRGRLYTMAMRILPLWPVILLVLFAISIV